MCHNFIIKSPSTSFHVLHIYFIENDSDQSITTLLDLDQKLFMIYIDLDHNDIIKFKLILDQSNYNLV